MEGDQDQQYKSLTTIADEEMQERYKGRRPFDYLAKYEDLPEEEREAAIKKDQFLAVLQHAVQSYFHNASARIVNPRVLIALPARMAADRIFGCDYTAKLLLGISELNDNNIRDYCNEINKLSFMPSIRESVYKLLQRDFIGDDTPYSECVWLYMFCAWLGCHTSTLKLEIDTLVDRARNDKDFKFTNTIGIDPKVRDGKYAHVDDQHNVGLRFAFMQQYQILENLLNRL